MLTRLDVLHAGEALAVVSRNAAERVVSAPV